MCIHVECIPSTHGQEMMSVLQINPFHQFLPPRTEVLLSSSQRLCHPRQQIGTDLAVDAQMSIPKSVLFPIRVPIELFQIVFSTIIRQVGDHTAFVQEEALGLRCWTQKIVVDVSTLGVSFNKPGASSILTWVYADTTSAACPEHPGFATFRVARSTVENFGWLVRRCRDQPSHPFPLKNLEKKKKKKK